MVQESNIRTSLIKIYKSVNNLSPPIMIDFFDLKNTRYDLWSKQLLKIPETSTSRYGTQHFVLKMEYGSEQDWKHW